MIVDLKEYVKFLCEHKMSGDQFLFCCLIHEKRFDLVYKMFNERWPFDRDELRDLEDRGYVINTNKGNDTWADMYIVTEKFEEVIYSSEEVMWQELLNTYPIWLYIDGKRIPAQGADLDQLRVIYFAKIGRSVARHKKIMELLAFGVNNEMVNMGIEKWIKGEQWRPLEAAMNEKPKSSGYGEKEF
jgi:hypothetical protein